MKTTLLSIVLGFFLSASAQELMTIGEIFNFEINDEFQYEGQGNGQPPNADRIKIIDKYYSSDSDTVFYVRYHDSYHTYVENNQLVYVFWTETDTVHYSDLDVLITNAQYWPPYDTNITDFDTIVEFSNYYCDSLINGYEYAYGTFEPVYQGSQYGRGIGLANYYHNDPAEEYFYTYLLFFYKKNNVPCGIADTTTVGIQKNTELIKAFEIFPNPATSKVFIRNPEDVEPFEIYLYDGIGRQIYSSSLFGKINELDIRNLEIGRYLLVIKSEGKTQSFCFIKE